MRRREAKAFLRRAAGGCLASARFSKERRPHVGNITCFDGIASFVFCHRWIQMEEEAE